VSSSHFIVDNTADFIVVVELSRLSSIVAGQNTPQFNRLSSRYKENRNLSFSIFYSSYAGTEATLDVIAADEDEYEYLMTALNALHTKVKDVRAAATPDELYLKDMWDRGDADKSGTLSLTEIIQLVAQMNITMPSSVIKKTFKTFDQDGSGHLNFEEFTEFIAVLRER
jgi:hypothetical protein